jgi:hypothetical protein
MQTRDNLLKEFRGDYLGNISAQTSPEEYFQNQTLRPILKLQNDIMIAVFKKQVYKYNKDFSNFTIDKKQKLIENILQKDEKVRKMLIGMIVGLFTDNEIEVYLQNTSNLNKRIISMLTERIQSQLQII